MMSNVKWYHKTAVVILALVLFFPVGAVLLWTSPKFSNKNVKFALTGVFFFLFAIVLVNREDSKNEISKVADIPKLTLPAGVEWKIEKEERAPQLSKSSIDVRLNKKVSEETLRDIALHLRSTRKEYENLFILYRLHGINANGTAWAKTHFNPNLEVKIIGASNAEEKIMDNNSDVLGEIIGKWQSEQVLMGALVVIYKTPEGDLKMKTTFKDGSSGDVSLTESKEGNNLKYQNEDDDSYYLIEANGNLSFYNSENMKFGEAQKAK